MNQLAHGGDISLTSYIIPEEIRVTEYTSLFLKHQTKVQVISECHKPIESVGIKPLPWRMLTEIYVAMWRH